MWLLCVSIPLLLALVLLARRLRAQVAATWRHAAARLLRWVRGPASARETHAFVFSGCTHGRADSVLDTFHQYAQIRDTAALGPDRGALLDVVVQRAAPRRMLELGLGCGYSAVRTLRLLPPAGRLLVVEQDPQTAELGEELILVAGFKHHQFQVLTCSSAEAIAGLRAHLFGDQDQDQDQDQGQDQGEDQGEDQDQALDMVLMDHQPLQYLPDLRALAEGGLLRAGGCVVLMVFKSGDLASQQDVLDHVGSHPQTYSLVRTGSRAMLELRYQEASARR